MKCMFSCKCYSTEGWLCLTFWRPLGFRDFRKKTPKSTWLCVGISPVWYALQTR